MPDDATTRDVALKLEAWAASLPADERVTVEGWMSLAVDTDQPITSVRWWFDPAGGTARPTNREAH